MGSRNSTPPAIEHSDSEMEDLDVDFKVFAGAMHKRATILLDELEQFIQHYRETKRDQLSLGDFRSSIKGVLKNLDTFLSGGKVSPKVIECSNFAFYEAIWAVTKTCEGITAFRRSIYAGPKPLSGKGNGGSGGKDRTYVDIVAQNGLEWIKVSRLNEKRVLWELAKSGWNADSDSEDNEDIENGSEEADLSIGLVKTMNSLVQSARTQKVRYQSPRIRLILPELQDLESKPIKEFLRQIRDLGVIIEPVDSLAEPIPFTREAMYRMSGGQFENFTERLNVDCSIALAFASDLSHNQVEAKEWHNDFIARQIKTELEDELLPRTLWPACGNRKLFCTRESAEKVQEITNIVGSETEKARTAILLGRRGLDQKQSVEEYQKLSEYKVPQDWQIPIGIVDADVSEMQAKLPHTNSMDTLIGSLLDVNRSTFLYGWTSGCTTITSNGQVTKALERIITENNIPEPDIGYPDIWVCHTPRSLVGKEVERDKKKRNAGAIRQSDALRKGRAG